MRPATAPASLRFPAEWEPCEAVWLAWPHNRETWPGRFDPVPAAFAKFVQAISKSTPVRILATGDVAHDCRARLSELGLRPADAGKSSAESADATIQIVEIDTNDCWVRDYGPTFVLSEDGGKVAVLWRFNAWGGKYEPYDSDASAGGKLAVWAGLRRVDGRLTMEGGALETDGAGRLLVNPGCLVDEARNPGVSQEEIAQQLGQLLGIHEIAWIDGGAPAGDDTDGHIDQVARFLDPENVVCAVAGSADDPSAEGLETNFRQLRLWSRQTDPPVQVHRLPTPPPRQIDGAAVPQSYCNFLRLGPTRILVPTFQSPESDAYALDLLKQLCPDAEVEGVDCYDIAWGLGALHCASCHEPAAPAKL
ncbi:agmatine deiminase family protein [Rhodopirellula sp. JC740]|uniref:Agmatine deiminase family protein n=1 Tax=Rhodopirellula halodulae TaxID=2894198 RepID=A0ABS8NK86_9BACT|nr:agmatine deiminase family protein [Rhodopirellula sp. JC740]MCC9643966.1 agmatine deiminase family protein [Rhodopirellula sp. JC740]